jgi:2-methylcitrate dehydratase PrpD
MQTHIHKVVLAPVGATGATAQFGAWVSALKFEAIPREVIEHARLCLIDGLGCGLFGATQQWGAIVAELAVELSGGGPATLWGRAQSASTADAALANGTAIHGFEIDDIHTRSLMHPGAVSIPAAFALAEARQRSGRDFLTAMVAGYEIGLRVGVCGGIPHQMKGYHPTGTAGCLGAAAAAANILGLSALQTTHALAIAATQASGLYCAVRTGAMTKRLHAGRAAQAGVAAALLAERGFTGSPDALEAPYAGYMSTLAESADLTPFVATLGQEWETPQVGFKAYAACASAHTIIDALDAMMKRGLTAANLDRLTIKMSRIGVNNVGWEYRPSTIVAAQMNGYFTAGMKLNDGQSFIDQYRDERIADPAIMNIIRKVEIVHDPELDIGGAPKRHAVKAHARATDGRTWDEYVEQRRGSPQHPLARAEIEQKFQRTAGAALEAAAVERLFNQVGTMERVADMREVGATLKSAKTGK